jgi:hypothetical protein
MLAKLANYKTTTSYTFTTSNTISEYPFPPGLVSIEGGYITIGSVNYPLIPVESRQNYLELTAIQVIASGMPQRYFVERDSFKIWPTPQGTYTGVIYYHYRDRNLSVADFTGGTITVTNGSPTVTNDTALFTPAMVGRWFTVTDPTVAGQGYWYRVIAYVSTTVLTLYQTYTGTTCTTTSYNIGETPELPEELHALLPWGTAADFYGGMRKDPDSFTYYDNLFYTGSPTNSSREIGKAVAMGGLIGGINNYSDRDKRKIIRRKGSLNQFSAQVFGTHLNAS